jgi:hypothetical protein
MKFVFSNRLQPFWFLCSFFLSHTQEFFVFPKCKIDLEDTCATKYYLPIYFIIVSVILFYFLRDLFNLPNRSRKLDLLESLHTFFITKIDLQL